MIILENICKAFGSHVVLNNFSASFSPGITCISAPSGAGKTTLLRLLLNLEFPDSGIISLPSGCRWAAVFQEDRLLEHMCAEGNLHFFLGKDFNYSRAASLLEELRLDIACKDPVKSYSGGMKRRFSLAVALLSKSNSLALDEPFSGLDEENKKSAIACILRETSEKTVLLVTHDMRDIQPLGANILNL